MFGGGIVKEGAGEGEGGGSAMKGAGEGLRV